ESNQGRDMYAVFYFMLSGTGLLQIQSQLPVCVSSVAIATNKTPKLINTDLDIFFISFHLPSSESEVVIRKAMKLLCICFANIR
ncbi:hypothetical protein SMA37_25495, partial [Escherichia coli]|uniref:hypothetical protein n=1 Tax=Escherichia coli TaxID=562 RepID=UPI00307AE4D4